MTDNANTALAASMTTTECQHCLRPVYWGHAPAGYRAFVHVANDDTECETE